MWGVADYSYDTVGNLTSKTLGPRTVEIDYDPATNRVSRARDSAEGNTWISYGYDERGNTTQIGSMRLVYDAAEQARTVRGPDLDVTENYPHQYLYDGNHKRVKQWLDNRDDAIYSAYGQSGAILYRRTRSGDTTDYIRMGGMVIARIQNDSEISYIHADHLGSPAAATDEDGDLIWEERFTPFGEQIHNPLDNRHNESFTGHIADSDTGLTYMQARYYDPVIGRFLSSDPVGFATGGVAYFNRYAYTANDPVNAIDPDGRQSAIPSFGILPDGTVTPGRGHPAGATLTEVATADAIQGAGATAGVASLALPGPEDLVIAGAAATKIGGAIAKVADDIVGAISRAFSRGCCFVAGTEILTDRGMVPIEQIRLGDLVIARNAETGETAFKPVTQLFVNDEDAVWELVVETTNGTSEVHRVTDNHPYYVEGQGWVEVADLQPGMTIATMEGDPVTLASITNTGKVERTFNFEVADFHTYFVGDLSVLVHNCGGGGSVRNRSKGPDRGPGHNTNWIVRST